MSTIDDSTTPQTTSGPAPGESAPSAAPTARVRRRAASRPAGPPPHVDPGPEGASPAPAAGQPAAPPEGEATPAARRTRRKKVAEPASRPAGADAAVEPSVPARRTRKKAAPAPEPVPAEDSTGDAAGTGAEAGTGAAPAALTASPRARRTRKKAAEPVPAEEPAVSFSTTEEPVRPEAETPAAAAVPAGPAALMFQAPPPAPAARPEKSRRTGAAKVRPAEPVESAVVDVDEQVPAEQVPAEQVPAEQIAAEQLPDGHATDETVGEQELEEQSPDEQEGGRSRRRRGGRGRRRKGGGEEPAGETESTDAGEPGAGHSGASAEATEAAETGSVDGVDGDQDGGESDGSGSSRRRRRRRRRGGDEDGHDGEEPATVTKVREGRKRDEISSVKGSTRLEAKKQRRREGREAGRRRPSVLTEAQFLARRESVERVMVVREHGDRTQIAVLEDGVLVEHYVNRSTGASMIGNVYLGKVQNVLPSMEAAFVDIGRGRNAVLYAGEVNWDAAGLDGQPRRIESALKSGDSVLVQVTKDPVGHKGARLTSQISLPGRFLVYVPRGEMTGISRKLPDTERARLKAILRDLVEGEAGVIVRTAAEGAQEEELSRDVTRLAQQWTDIEKKAKSASAPALLHGEPDLAIKVVRDIFNEDFAKLVVSGDASWHTIESYVSGVAPDLAERIEKWTGTDEVFHAYRIDEQLTKALDRKVWLPSGGSLVIDRTEAMTVIDVNTGKFTGSGGNLEETVTRNNLEAAEEIVRQLRLRDIGGIIVVDFIDMVLESNRDLVLRRLFECLGRDRTKHQVAEVTSLGLVQMTRKRIGQGLLEVFSEPCETCHGRGVVLHTEPVEGKRTGEGRGAARSADPTAAERAAAVAKVHAAARRARQDESESADDAAAETDNETDNGAAAPDVAPAEAATAEAATAEAATAEAAPEKAAPRRARRRATRGAGPAATDPVPTEESEEPQDGGGSSSDELQVVG